MSIKVERDRGYPLYLCPECNEFSFSYEDLKNHMDRDHHPKKPVFQTSLDISSLNHFSLTKKEILKE